MDCALSLLTVSFNDTSSVQTVNDKIVSEACMCADEAPSVLSKESHLRAVTALDDGHGLVSTGNIHSEVKTFSPQLM